MNRDGFADKVEAEARRLYSLALAHLGDPAAAEEVAQEACVRAWVHRRTLRDESGFGPWVAAIARNLCRDRLREGRRAAMSLERLVESGFDCRGRTEAGASEEELMRAMVTELPEGYREAFALRYGAGMSPPEIATFLGTTVASVDTRLSRARKILVARLERVQARVEEGR